MAQKSDSDLLIQKEIIKAENTNGANTKTRIGQMFEDIIDSKLNNDDLIDEDDMASNSAVKVPSQQSVKAYVDGAITGGSVDTVPTEDSTNAVQSGGVFDELALKAPLANPAFTGTATGLTKAMVGLSNVDNTSDDTKNSAAVTLTNKTISGDDNTFLEIPASAILVSDTEEFDPSEYATVDSPVFTGTVVLSDDAVLSLFNTVDQTTNYERLRIFVSSDIFNISTENGGSGTNRTLILTGGGKALLLGGADIGGGVKANSSSSAAGYSIFGSGASAVLSAASGIQYGVTIIPTISQNTTAAYKCLFISPFENSLGSGTSYLIDAGSNDAASGGGTHNRKFAVTRDGKIILYAVNTAVGVTGAQTINRPTGHVNFAAGATSLVVTNSTCSATSIVFATVRTNDSTAIIKNVVPASGSFTINLNAAATAETSVGFIVIN